MTLFKTKSIQCSTTSTLLMAGSALLSLAACDQSPDDPFAAAQQSIEAGQLHEAQIYLSQALKEAPQNTKARMTAAELALMLGNTPRAISLFKGARTDSAFSDQAIDGLALAYLLDGNLEMASSTLESRPINSARAHRVLVEIAQTKTDAVQAKQLLAKGLEQFPNSAILQVRSAEMAWQEGRRELAREEIDQILGRSPDEPEAHMFAGRIAMHNGELDKARGHFEGVVDFRPSNQSAMLALAAISRDQGRAQDANDWIVKASEAGPPSPIALYFLAQMAFDNGKTQDAFDILQAMPDRRNFFPALTRLDGLVAAERGQSQSAIASLERYFSNGGEDPIARRVLAQNLAVSGKKTGAFEVLEPLISRVQIDPISLALATRLANELGRPEAPQLRARLEEMRNPGDIDSALREAAVAIQGGKWEEADRLFTEQIEGDGARNVVLLNNAANVKLKLGQNRAATQLARRALALAPDSPFVLDTMGWALFKTNGATPEAGQMLNRARSLAPQNIEIADHVQEYRAATS